MDVFEVLTRDHQRVCAMLRDIQSTHDRDLTLLLQKEIGEELDAHAQLEESVLYPYLKEAEATRDVMKEMYRHHREMDDLLLQWPGLSSQSVEWCKVVTRLQDLVEHHVEEEENRLFPRARRVISDERARKLGEEALQVKQDQLGSVR